MEVLKSRDDLCRVEERRRGGETSGAAQIREEFATADVGEEQVEEAGVLAAPGEGDEEGVFDLLKNRQKSACLSFPV